MKNSFIDVHNHGAWGIDDGLMSEEEAKSMLKQAQEDGITNIIATPHRLPKITKEEINEQLKRTNEFAILAELFGIVIHKGNEFFLNKTSTKSFNKGNMMTLADSNYVLVEFDMRKDISEIPEADDWLYEITLLGYRPVIAHVERYYKEVININQIKYWIELGCYIQVNRTSCLKMHGEVNYDHAITLLDGLYVHVIASDAHRIAGNRICKMSDVYEMLYKRYGKDNAKLLCCGNPQRILQNEMLNTMKKRPSLMRRWRKR